ncbi:MAG TPA: protein kinase [Pirellulales bacterium]|nr:protein kinase [Pirellulales bacterium]
MSSTGSSQRTLIGRNPSESSSRRRIDMPGDAACDPDQATVISQRPPLASTPARATSPAELSKQLAGEQLNHFQLLEYVGGGGMGAVFRALDTMLNREVALKVLSRDQGADDETRRRFQNEAQSAARLDHENIARVYYVGEDRGLNYIVFEFIEGTNLRDVVERKGPLSAPEALGYTLQVAHALAHASSRDVVHRDIKPSNLIIMADGRAKLVDMGLARLHQVHSGGEDLTASGVTLGTFDYISPEQARDPRSADVRSDIYSLGCTLYYMLTGRPPFPDGTVLQKLLQHNSDPPPDPREFNPALPPELSAVVSKMLAKDPLRRYQHPGELIADLHLLAEQIGFPLPGLERPAWASEAAGAHRPSLVRHVPWMVPVGLLLVAVVLLDRPWPGLLDPESEAVQAAPQSSSDAASPTIEKQAQQERTDQQPADLSDSASQGRDAIGSVVGNKTDEAASNPATPAEPSSRRASQQAANSQPRDHLADSVATIPKAPARLETTADPMVDPSPIDSDPMSEPMEPAASPPGATSSTEPIAEAAAALPKGLLVVGDGQKGPQRYATLAEACAAAKNGDTIELRYSGPQEELPLVLSDLRVVIRSGEGYRPLVRFRPRDTNPVNYARGMVKLNGGGLRLAGVALELDLSRAAPSENWSLFELQSVESLWFEECLLVVRNASNQGGPSHDKVAFVRLDANPRVDMLMPGAPAATPVQMTLRNCVALGEAVFAYNPAGQPMGLAWQNGLLATCERLLVVGGSTSMEPSETSRVRLDLKQLTVFARQGLCRIGASDAAAPSPDVEIHCSDCVFASDGNEPALVDQTGNDPVNRLKSKLHWDAGRNVYEGYRTFWKITSLAASAGEPDVATYTDWCELWGSRERQSMSMVWRGRRDLARRPLNLATLADFELDQDDRRELPGGPGELSPGLDAAALPGWLVP